MGDPANSPADVAGPRAAAVDRDLCIGAANCEYWAPNTFEVDDDAKSVVINPSGDPPDLLERALQGCPSSAITLSPAATGGS